MNLVIDIGNSRTKLFVFNGSNLISKADYESLTVQDLRKIFSKHAINASILSSVARIPAGVINFLKKNSSFIELKASTRFPVKNRYRTPETLGKDRIANAAGAGKIFPGKN